MNKFNYIMDVLSFLWVVSLLYFLACLFYNPGKSFYALPILVGFPLYIIISVKTGDKT